MNGSTKKPRKVEKRWNIEDINHQSNEKISEKTNEMSEAMNEWMNECFKWLSE